MSFENLLSLLSARETGQTNHRGGYHCAGSGTPAGSGSLRSWASQYALKHCVSEPCDFGCEARATIGIAVSPDGALVASTHGDHSVKIVDYSTGRLLRELTGHRRTPWTVKFHPLKPSIVVSGSLDNEVRIWNAHTGELLQCKDFGGNISSIAFHQTGKFLAVAVGHKLFIWEHNEASDRFEEVRIVLRTAKTMRTVHFHPLAQSYILTTERFQPQTTIHSAAGAEQSNWHWATSHFSQRCNQAPGLEHKLSMASSASSAASDILYLNRTQQGEHTNAGPVNNQDWTHQAAFQAAAHNPAAEHGAGDKLIYRGAAPGYGPCQLSDMCDIRAHNTERDNARLVNSLQQEGGYKFQNSNKDPRSLTLLVEHSGPNRASTSSSDQFITRASGNTGGEDMMDVEYVQETWRQAPQANSFCRGSAWTQGTIEGQDAVSLGDTQAATQQSSMAQTASPAMRSQVFQELQGQSVHGVSRVVLETSGSSNYSQFGSLGRSPHSIGSSGEVQGFALGEEIEPMSAIRCVQDGCQQQHQHEMEAVSGPDVAEQMSASNQILAQSRHFSSEVLHSDGYLQRSVSFAYGQHTPIVPQASGQMNNSGDMTLARLRQDTSRAHWEGIHLESSLGIAPIEKENTGTPCGQRRQRSPPLALRLHSCSRATRSSSWSPGAASHVLNNNLSGFAVTRTGDVTEVPALHPSLRMYHMYASMPSQDLPCTTKLSLWKFLEDQPFRVLDSESPQMLIEGAVLCSEMGVSIASSGRILAVCTASSDPFQDNHTSGFRYEVKLYSLEQGTMGQLIRSREISAGHCLTSIQFSPDCALILLSYGEKHSSLVRELVSDQHSMGQIRAVLEVYRVSDLALIRVLHSIEDDANTACFHPFPGEGIIYGTKDGKLRILRTVTNEKDAIDASQFVDELLSVDELLLGESDWPMDGDMIL